MVHPQFHHRDIRAARAARAATAAARCGCSGFRGSDTTRVPRGEKRRRHFLRRGLAGAAGDRHHARPGRTPHALRRASCSAGSVSSTSITDRIAAVARHRAARLPRDARRRPRRRSRLAAANAAPSNRSPRMAMNRSPRRDRARVDREAVEHAARRRRSAAARPRPRQRRRRSARAVQRAPATSSPPAAACGAARVPRAPPPRRRTAACASPITWSSRVPCPR